MTCIKRIKAMHYLAASMIAMGYAFLIDYWLLQNSRQPTRFDPRNPDHR